MNIICKEAVLATVLLAATSVSGFASVIPTGGNIGSLSGMGNQTSRTIGHDNIDPPTFSDEFTFTVTNPVAYTISVTNGYTDTTFINNFELTFGGITVTAFNNVTQSRQTASLTGSLAAGSYSFLVSGDTNENSFPSYGGSLSVTALSSVPLPASLPMFGGGLLALVGFSYGLNRWVAPKAKTAV